jgi:hypothetical protein
MSRRKAQGPSVSFFAFQDIITSVVGIFVLITLIMMIDLVSKTNSATEVRKRYQDTYSSMLTELQDQLEQLENRSAKLELESQSLGSVVVWNQKETLQDLQSGIDALTQQSRRSEQRTQELQRVVDDQTIVKSKLEIESKKRSPDREELAKLLGELDKLNSQIGDLETDEPLIFKSQSLGGRSVVIVEIAPDGVSVLELANDVRSDWTGGSANSLWKGWLSQQQVSRLHFFVLVRPGAAKRFGSVRAELDRVGASYGYDLIDGQRTVKLRGEATR